MSKDPKVAKVTGTKSSGAWDVDVQVNATVEKLLSPED